MVEILFRRERQMVHLENSRKQKRDIQKEGRKETKVSCETNMEEKERTTREADKKTSWML